jgi:hypothetical protein
MGRMERMGSEDGRKGQKKQVFSHLITKNQKRGPVRTSPLYDIAY